MTLEAEALGFFVEKKKAAKREFIDCRVLSKRFSLGACSHDLLPSCPWRTYEENHSVCHSLSGERIRR
jgi:hypothetical protein